MTMKKTEQGVLRKCSCCGKEFLVTERYPSGDWKNPKKCTDCMYKKPETMQLVCQRCNKPFYIYRDKRGNFNKQRKYCDNCSKESYRDFLCKNCGKQFRIYRDAKGYLPSTRKLCDDCVKAKQYLDLICARCGKKFRKYRDSKGRLDPVKYCSEECLTPSTQTRICEVCGKTFTLQRGKNGQFTYYKYKKYCSSECRSKALHNNIDYTQRQEKIKQTNKERYGVEYPVQLKNPYSTKSKINSNIGNFNEKTRTKF